MINFEPLANRVLVDDIKEDRSELRIQLPPSSKEKPTNRATVVAIGPDVKAVIVGDIIYIGEWIGQLVNIDGKQYRSMNAIDILGKVKDGHTDQADTQATPVN
jgi:co-chaperonin GroES (HSP10)